MTCVLLLFLKMNFEKIPCTSVSQSKKVYGHISGAYCQKQLWIQAPLKDASLEMNADSYGFTFVKNKTENLIFPGIVTPSLKTFLILVRTCGKCAHKNGYVLLQGSWNQV